MIRQILSYIGVGMTNALVTGITMVLLKAMNCHYVLYTVAGYSLGFINSFLLNGYFTFRRSKLKSSLFTRFLIINVSLLGLVQLIQITLIEGINAPEIPSVVFGMIIYTGIGFFLNRSLFQAAPQKAI